MNEMLEPQNKTNIDFQSSKKMKKRRELDALVCNGKIRRKSKSGHELLRTESDSSEIDEFSIAAQKTLFRNRGRSSCSSCKTALILLMAGICLVISSGLIWLHFDMKNTIQLLQDKIALVERKNTESTSAIGNIQPQIDEMDKHLKQLKSEEVERLKLIESQIGKLNKSSESLQSVVNVKSNDDLNKKLDQLTQIPIISKSVAEIGADVANLKSQIDALNKFKQDTNSQIQALSQKLLQSDDREGKPQDKSDDLVQKLVLLQQSIGDMNVSVWNKIDSVNTALTGQQMKFEMLDNKTRQLQLQMAQGVHPDDGDSPIKIPDSVQQQIEQKIFEHIHQMVPNTTDSVTDPSLATIITNMDNITNMVKGLKADFAQLKTDHSVIQPQNPPVKGDNDTELQSRALDKLEALNKTVDHLSHDVSTLIQKFIMNQNSLTSLTRVVEGLKQYVHIMDIKFDKSLNQTVRTDDPDLANLPTPDNFTLTLDDLNKTEDKITTTPRPLIHMKLIKTENDANIGLHRWDHNGNGVLDGDELESLPDYMPDPPSLQHMLQFDFDKNGSIDEKELKIALGFREYPNDEERERLADLG